MKRVCHISNAHKRYDVRIVERECVSLVSAGYETYFVINDNSPNEIYKGVNIRSTGYIFKNRVGRIFNGIYQVYKEALRINADIYHLHDPELLLVACLLKNKSKCVIFDSHEYYYEQIQSREYIPIKIRKMIAKMYYCFESFVTKKIDGVIIPTKVAGKNVFEGRAKRIAFVNNVPRLDEMPMAVNSNIHRKGICYTGGLTYNRGIWHIMKAADKVKVPLVLAGVFSSQTFQDELFSDEAHNVISYRGNLNREDVYELYNECAIGMCTLLDVGQYSKTENFSTKVYEYMMAGLPVILSDFPYNRNMVEKYRFGLLAKPDDIDDIAEKINYLLNHEDEAIRMGNAGKKLVLEQLNWSVEEKKLLQLYKDVLL